MAARTGSRSPGPRRCPRSSSAGSRSSTSEVLTLPRRRTPTPSGFCPGRRITCSTCASRPIRPSFLGWAGDYDAASPYLDSAARLSEHRGGGPRLRAWTHCVRAELLTKTSRDRTSEACAEIERAKTVLAAGGAHDDQYWLDFFDSSMLRGFEAGTGLASALRVLRPDATPTTKVNRAPRSQPGGSARSTSLLTSRPANGATGTRHAGHSGRLAHPDAKVHVPRRQGRRGVTRRRR